jgi:Vitamin K-dependent gamma-carboxylase
VNRHVVDPWFTYDQFEFFFQWAPKQGDPWGRFYSIGILTTAVFFGMLAVMGGINGVNHSFPTCGTIFLICFAYRFFLFADNFHDGHYLLWLLGIITVVSGGGGFFLIFTETDSQMTLQQQQDQQHKRRVLIQSSEWGAITLRLQYAVVFLFSSIWKLHTDYLQGHILRGHLLGFDSDTTQQVTLPPGSSFWATIEDIVGQNRLFQFLGLCGILIDFGLLGTMLLRRPANDNVRSYVIWTCIVHIMVASTMGHKLGYSFSLACLVGVLIFHPIGGGSKPGSEINSAASKNSQSAIKKRIRSRQQYAVHVEANLLQWIHRYATGSPQARATRQQQLFTIAWLLVQIAIPLRMPFVSQGNYPFNAKGYRFSWTMMLHTRQSSVYHVGKYTASPRAGVQVVDRVIPLQLFYLLPECSGNTLQRRDYMPELAVAEEDPRTLPLLSILTGQQHAFITAHTRYITRVGGGMSMVLHRITPRPCNSTYVSVFGIHFAKLNGRGAFCRTLDPTINLPLGEILRYQRSWLAALWSVMLDNAPLNYETMLQGIGTMNPKVEYHRTSVEEKAKGARRIEFIADRAACLSSRPLALWPNSYPLAVMPLEVPANAQLFITWREHREATTSNVTVTAGNQWDILGDPKTAALKLNTPHPVAAVSVEIGILINDTPIASRVQRCGDTAEEDILFALIFMS